MKPSTLFKRYYRYGYKGENNLDHLIRWLFLFKQVHIGVTFCTMRFPKHGKEPSPFHRFWGYFIPNINTNDITVTQITGMKTFKDPEDAKLDALRRLLPSMYVLNLIKRK